MWPLEYRVVEVGQTTTLWFQESTKKVVLWKVSNRRAGRIILCDSRVDNLDNARAVVLVLTAEPFKVIATFGKGEDDAATFAINGP